MSEITVLIPTIGRTDKLNRVLEALNRQNYDEDFRIVVINDGAGDEFKIDSEGKEYELIVINHDFNRGRAAACNSGLKIVETPLVVILDDDIVPDKNWLQAHVDYHCKFTHSEDVCFGKVTWGKELGNSDVLNYLETRGRFFNCVKHDHNGVMTALLTGNTSFKTEFIREHMFDESFTVYGQEDLELGGRLFESGMVCRFSEEARGLHLHDIDFENMCKLSFNDGYSAAHYFTINPDRKWDIATLIAKYFSEEIHEENLSLGEAEEYFTYKGADRYFTENSSWYRKFKEPTDNEYPEPETEDELLSYAVRAELLRLNGESERSLELITYILERFPGLTWIRFVAAGIYIELTNREKALELLEELSFKWNPSLLRSMMKMRAGIYENMDRNSEALNIYKHLIETGDRNYMNYFRLWVLKRKLGIDDLDRDCENIVNSIEKCRNIADIEVYNKASVLKSVGNYSKAVKMFQELFEQDGVDGKLTGGILYHLGDCFLQLNSTGKAEKYLTECLKKVPEHKAAVKLLGEISERRS